MISKRRSFIRQCAMAGVAMGLADRGLAQESPGGTKRSIRSRNRSAAGIGKSLRPGEVAALSGPGTDAPNTIANVMYLTTAGGGSGSGNNYFANWCSGVYAPDDGPVGAMVFCNGGDGDYWGNEVYKFALDTRTWSRASERSTGLNGTTTTVDGDPNFDAMVWGEHATPGGKPTLQPGVPHSYDQMEYLPPHLGGGSKGAFMFPTRTIVYRTRRYKHPHVFDLNARVWRRGSAAAGIIGIGNVDSPSWCFDSHRDRFWGVDGGLSGIFISKINYLTFDAKTGLATAGSVAIPQHLTPRGYPVSRYWPTGDLMLLAGQNNDGTAFSLRACQLANAGAVGFVTLALSGDTIPIPSGGYGLAYCDDLDCVFVRTSSAHRQKIWKLIPPKSDYLTNPWIVEELTMKGVTVGAKDNRQGMWKRFMYAPPLKCLIWVDDINGPVYAYRPVGT